MAEEVAINGECHDLSSLLASEERDYLVRNNGEQVPSSLLIFNILKTSDSFVN